MIKKYALVFIALLCSFFYGFGQTTIGIQDFEATPATPTMTFTGGSVATGNGLFPSDPKYVSGSRGRQVRNTTTTILFSSVDASAYSSVYFTARLASFAGTSGNGSDGGDYVIVSVSTDGGTNWSQELEVNGNSNAKWSFASGTGVASIAYDGDNSTTSFAPAGGGNRTTDGYSTITVTGLPNSSNLRVRLEVSNNSGNEYWVFDDAEISGTSTCIDAVDYANIQFPTASPQTITVGDTFNVYAQVYEPTVTEAGGAGAGITAWVGYNTTNDNPNNTGWTWIPATFNVQSGNNDEFIAEIGSALAPGTYYYASRFELNSCGNYIYGGTGGVWNNDSVQLIVEPDQVDFCNVDFPKTGSINIGDNYLVYAQAYAPGITNVAGAASNIPGVTLEAWIGYNTVGINHQPWNASGWTWVPAAYNSDFGNNDQYVAEIGSVLPAGTYYYASRFRLNGSDYSYGGIQADNVGNFWDATNNNGTLTVTNPPCNELMISEYVEGSSNNKYIEIYNPTGTGINLNNYRIAIYSNGSATVSGSYNLTGTLASFGTYVIGNTNAVIYTADVTNNTVTGFNGNDAIALQTSGGVNIDVVGVIGNSSTFGQDTTLRRKSTIQNPNTTYSGSEWDSYGQDIIDLGNHTSDCQGSTPEIQLVDNTATNQNCGFTIDFGTQALSTNTDLTFDIENVGSADLDISSFGITGDYTIVSPTAPLTITSGNSQTVTVRFTPTANGTRNGVLTINNNDSNEGSCTVNLTGVGFTPAPEIDVERNTGGSIPNGSGANAGYNTIFATTTIGNTTAPKTYHIANEGTANLSLTSITSSNPAEFSISLNPGATTINPSTEVDFEIIFSPTGIGLRTATITILSNDADENPYTFNVQGNGDCASGTLTFLPDNGPVGTIVNVTSSTSNFGGSTAASIGGIPATVAVISANEIEVTIPTGASTGSLEINDDLGCLSSGLFTVIDELISSCEGNSGLTPTDLFISEVTDKGTGSHSYVEIYNGTGAAISLNTYEVRIHNNGATNATTTIPLSGTIANDGIVVIAFGGTNATDPEGGYTADFFSGGGGINEDDHIRLYDGANWVDLWGDTSGNPFTIASKDYTYRRKNSGITVPLTTWNVNDWEAFTPVDYSDIGNFDFSTGVPPTVASGPILSYSCNTATISVTGNEGFTGSNPLAYQWYYSAPGDTGWTEVPDNVIYDNPTTATLDILDTSTLEKYQYYCQVREDDQDCYEASDAVQLILPITTWTGTWSSPPTSSKIAIIDADYNTGNGTGGQTSFDACSLIINTGNTLSISNNTYVNVVNNVTNYGTINIQTRGSFVQQGDGAAAGTFTNSGAGIANVAKTTAQFDSSISEINYTYWSSPINDPSNPGFGENIADVFPSPVGNRRYYFMAQNYIDSYFETGNNNDNSTLGQDDIDDNANDWQSASTTMEVGRGYAVTASGLPPSPGIFTDNSTVFSGALNTGDITVTLYKNNNEINDNNWNFIGNPYPSAISVDDFFLANAAVDDVNIDPSQNPDGLTEGAIFLWSQSVAPDAGNNGNENVNFAQSDYAIINRATSTAGTSGIIPSRYIPSGQGFFVAFAENLSTPVNSVTSGNVVFTNSMRSTGNNTQFFEANNSTQEEMNNLVIDNNILWLNLTSDNGVFSQIAVAYVNGASDNYDGWSYDTPHNLSTGTYATLYSIIDSSDRQFAIQGKSPESLSLDEVIPLGFDTSIGEATLYKFSIAQLEGSFMNQNDIFIIDNLLNKTHNLKESDYNFTSEVGEFTDRFEIVFTRETLSSNEAKLNSNSLQIIELLNGDVQFKLSSPFEMKSIEVVDLLGRTLYKLDTQGNSQTFSLNNLSQATYLAKVKLSNGKVITKKAIKRK
jgi:hypothetical protein